MKIKYLGTAAYEGIPSLFCNCRVCRTALEKGGRDLRSRSQALVNDDLLLDFPADTVWHYQRFHLDWTKISDCLITHSHSDHLYPKDIVMAAPEYTHQHREIHFCAAQDGYDKIKAVIDRPNITTKGAVSVSLVEPGKRFFVGENEKYSVLPLWANHAQDTSPVIYSITCGEKRILYAHDSGVFYEKTWAELKKEGLYDLVSLDCTGCLQPGWRDGHMSFETNLETIARMKSEKLIGNKTIVVINHFTHNGGQIHEELVAEAEKYGIIVAYDGLEIEF